MLRIESVFATRDILLEKVVFLEDFVPKQNLCSSLESNQLVQDASLLSIEHVFDSFLIDCLKDNFLIF